MYRRGGPATNHMVMVAAGVSVRTIGISKHALWQLAVLETAQGDSEVLGLGRTYHHSVISSGLVLGLRNPNPTTNPNPSPNPAGVHVLHLRGLPSH